MIRYEYLLEMLRAGIIDNLEKQVPYHIQINGKKICTYKSDFEYELDGKKVVEDYKGVRTAIYKLKKKMVEAQYGIEIVEVTHKEIHDMQHPRRSELRKIYDRIQSLRIQRKLQPYQTLDLENLK